MDKPILGYWVEYDTGIYFVRDERDALPEHVSAFTTPMKGVIITTVTEYADIAHYVILRHLKHDLILYTRWTPGLPRPLETDHTGKIAFEVVDFAESIEEAEAIVKHLKSQK